MGTGKRVQPGSNLLSASQAFSPDCAAAQKIELIQRERAPLARVLNVWSSHRAAAVMSAWTRMLTLLATMSTTRTGEAICVKGEAICVKGATGEAVCVKGAADSITSDATVRNPLSSGGRYGLDRTRLSG